MHAAAHRWCGDAAEIRSCAPIYGCVVGAQDGTLPVVHVNVVGYFQTHADGHISIALLRLLELLEQHKVAGYDDLLAGGRHPGQLGRGCGVVRREREDEQRGRRRCVPPRTTARAFCLS